MAIIYDKLFETLAASGHNRHWLRLNGISPSVIGKLDKGGGLNARSIDRLCALLDCQPGDLMEYVPDNMRQE